MRSIIAVAALLFASNFEVAAIHPHDPKNLTSTIKFLPGGEASIMGMTIRNIIFLAWQLPPDRVTGGPKWIDSDLYDIDAKPPAGSASSMDAERPRIQALLENRFQLKVHRETKTASVYELTFAKTGLKMQDAKGPDPSYAKGSIVPWNSFITDLSQRLHRPVIDKTGIKGVWYINLHYDEDKGPSIFTAVEEQLGLKLNAGTGPIDMLVIDSVSRPTPN